TRPSPAIPATSACPSRKPMDGSRRPCAASAAPRCGRSRATREAAPTGERGPGASWRAPGPPRPPATPAGPRSSPAPPPARAARPLHERWTAPLDARQRAAFAAGDGDALDGAFRVDLATYVPDDLLVMADRLSMAHSLEVRAPFCDHRLVELSLSIAPRAKLAGGRLKALLKRAFADVLPRELLTRRKQGFMIPLARWLRTDLREAMEDLL